MTEAILPYVNKADRERKKKEAVKGTRRCSELDSDTFDKQVAIRAQKDAIKCKVRSVTVHSAVLPISKGSTSAATGASAKIKSFTCVQNYTRKEEANEKQERIHILGRGDNRWVGIRCRQS